MACIDCVVCHQVVDATQAWPTATFEASILKPKDQENICCFLTEAAEAAEAEIEAIMREEVRTSHCGQRMSFKQFTLLGSPDSLAILRAPF